MNLRWFWFDHIPAGIDLTEAQRKDVHARAKLIRARHPNTMHKHGSLIATVMALSIVEAIMLLAIILWVFPMAQSLGSGARMAVILGLPLIICVPFWFAIATAYNMSHSPFVREALNEMGFAVCVKCGYALRGLDEKTERCPECGTQPTESSSVDSA